MLLHDSYLVYIIRFRCLRPGDADVALICVLKSYFFGRYVIDCEVSRLVFLLFAACPTCLSYLTAVIWPEEYGTLKSTFTLTFRYNSMLTFIQVSFCFLLFFTVRVRVRVSYRVRV